MGKVIVFGTGVVAYGVIDECAKAAHEVIHVTTKSDDIAARSKLITERCLVNFDSELDPGLVEFFVSKGAEWNGALLVPVNDQYIVFVSRHLAQLSRHYTCTVQPWETHTEIINKNLLYGHAHNIGVPAPVIHCPRNGDELSRLSGALPYPCILKPYQTPDFFGVFGKKVLVAHDENTLIEQYAVVRAHDLDVMVSEIIPGSVDSLVTYVSCLDADGDVIAEFFTQKVRENTDFGVASVIKTIEPIREVRESALQLLRHFSYQGFSAVEMKRDDRDGKFKLIEINSRPVLYHRLFVAAGINIIEVLYSSLVERKKLEKKTGVPGINWMHNMTELYGLKRSMWSSDSTVKEFMQPYRQPHIFALPFFSDPKPLLSMLWKEIVSFWHRSLGGKRNQATVKQP